MPDLLYETDGHLGLVTLNRPDARNAYSAELVSGLVDALDRAEADDDVHVVVITGAGSAFCAGGDLKAMRDKRGMFSGDAVELRNNYRFGIQSITRRFDSFEKPVVAAINGPAIGAGMGLATMCDVRVAARGAKFGATFARVGLVPGDGSGYLLARAIGYSRALELLLTARIFDADEAHRLGFAHYVVEPDEVMDKAREVAETIAALPPKSVQLTKASMNQSWSVDTEAALHIAAAFQSLTQNTDEHLDAVKSILDELS